jgi:GNAT superfamily N-acetyltransferase
MLREAVPADAAAISALLLETFEEFRPLYAPEAFAATVLDPDGVLARMQEGPVWVVEREASIVGTVAARRVGDSVFIRGMAVSPSARGLGIATVLLNQVERFAGCMRLVLYTTPFLKSAIRLYERSGFHFTGETIAPHGTQLLRMEKPRCA